ncbi:MAG: 4-(cytidine 5'-diphospho)-2-C-methyl-D-erythritol kinase [Candidatus Cryptobacteroides sp.]
MILETNVKVNLGLNVLRKREDGFHDIETLFLPCNEYGDVLEVVTGDDYSRTSASLFARYSEEQLAQGISGDGKLMITIARAEGVDWEAEKDLCARAYSLLDKDFGLPAVKIFLEKKAPVGAGLGGGSADAAFTLRALNGLFGLALSDEALAGYASRLGSDCAFFIFNTPMLGSGRGEILEKQDFDLDALGLELKVVVPEGISVSTAEAYRGIVPKEPEMRIRDIVSLPPERWKDLLVNDFEDTVFAGHKELAAIKQSLYDSGAVYASMSGSGSALFGLYPA